MKKCILLIIFTLIFPLAGYPDDFLATRPALIHQSDNSQSPSLGRLEQGDKALIIGKNSTGKYLKVRTPDGIEGWVYKKRGKIIYTSSSPSETGEYRFYFGNLHSHVSELSKEKNIPQSTFKEAFQYAKDHGLDFLAITLHNHLAEPTAYSVLLSVTNNPQYYIPGEFVPIAGQEFSSINKGNHVNVFEADAWIDPAVVPNGEFKKLYEEWIPLHKTKYTVLQFNHPNSVRFTAHHGQEYGMDDYGGDIEALWRATDHLVSTIEIISTRSHDDATDKPHVDENKKRVNAYLFALNEGWHLAPTANQDNHRKNWGTGTESRTACISKALTKEEILSAIRERRCYATEDENMRVIFRAGDKWMGSVVDVNEVSGLFIKVEDDGEPKATYTVNLYKDKIGGDKLSITSPPVETYNLHNGESVVYPIDSPEADTYYFLRVTQSDNPGDPNGTADDAWTAPIWVKEIGH